MYYQNQGKKAWLGPERIFAIHKNSIFIIANGNVKKIPRSNVQFLRRDAIDNDNNPTTDATNNSLTKVNFDLEEEEEDAIDNDQETPNEFGENLNSEEIKELQASKTRRRTRSMTAVERRELERDQIIYVGNPPRL